MRLATWRTPASPVGGFRGGAAHQPHTREARSWRAALLSLSPPPASRPPAASSARPSGATRAGCRCGRGGMQNSLIGLPKTAVHRPKRPQPFWLLVQDVAADGARGGCESSSASYASSWDCCGAARGCERRACACHNQLHSHSQQPRKAPGTAPAAHKLALDEDLQQRRGGAPMCLPRHGASTATEAAAGELPLRCIACG